MTYRLGGLDLHVYGTIVSVAVLVGTFVFARELERGALASPHWAWRRLPLILLAAVVGAKLAGAIDDWPRFRADPLAYLLDPAGHAFLGGALAGCAVVHAAARRSRLSVSCTFDALAPALLVGWGIGRIACHVTGDGCYGIPFALGIAYPHGAVPSQVAVHPTPLYEALAALVGLLLLRRLRGGVSGTTFASALAYYAVVRFGIEIVRRNPRLGPLTQAQWTCLALGCACLVWWWARGRPARAAGAASGSPPGTEPTAARAPAQRAT